MFLTQPPVHMVVLRCSKRSEESVDSEGNDYYKLNRIDGWDGKKLGDEAGVTFAHLINAINGHLEKVKSDVENEMYSKGLDPVQVCSNKQSLWEDAGLNATRLDVYDCLPTTSAWVAQATKHRSITLVEEEPAKDDKVAMWEDDCFQFA